jgi:hypothetical protein
MIAFCIFAIRVRIPDQYLFWLFVVFFGGSALALVGIYGLLDWATQRVLEVVPGQKRARCTTSVAGKTGPSASFDEKQSRELPWEIGAKGIGLVPHWIATILVVALAAVVGASGMGLNQRAGDHASYSSMVFCVACGLIVVSIWTTVVRLRIDGPVVTVERPYALFQRRVSFDVSEIDQVDLKHFAHDRKHGQCLTISLRGGRRIKYSESEPVVDIVVGKLMLAISGSGKVSHPLSDEAIR